MRKDNVMEVSFCLLILEVTFIVVGNAVHPGCQCLVFSSTYGKGTGIFKSPDYPTPYSPNIDCLLYSFVAGPEELAKITFEEFDVYGEKTDCLRGDYVKVFVHLDSARINEYTPWESVYCGNIADLPTVIYSSGPALVLEFHSGSRTNNSLGFIGQFTFEDKRKVNAYASFSRKSLCRRAISDDLKSNTPGRFVLPTAIEPNVSETRSSCDMIINSDTSKTGVIMSPLYPSPYPSKTTCQYEFQGRGKELVRIIFHDFYLHHLPGKSKDCEGQDLLNAFIHIDGRMEKIDSFCGTTVPKPVMSNGPRLKLEFRSLHSSRYSRGFNASYSFTENFGMKTGLQVAGYPCAFVLNSNETKMGHIHSPNFPGFYPRNTECHYFFYGNANEKVHLHFNYFDVEGVLPCEASSASDYVEFSNFIALDRKYHRHCGQLKEFDIESDRKFFRVTFKSNDRLDGSGFNATYQFLDEVEVYKPVPTTSGVPQTLGNLLILLLVYCLHF
ncbi:suppressor of lurcher protein 1 isoform X2 [Dendroctonus ponderosae]|uniref:suppressor of lurcher protein 1 isoform X2 n=1 Tax=Dendroctonus ponderosae TaxID=77166 RepID=UPI002035FC01|nr:suppressor of lurcher protein 1 isoform X2 [Dendroctonus ponderosae]